jgi:hypothetical protein
VTKNISFVTLTSATERPFSEENFFEDEDLECLSKPDIPGQVGFLLVSEYQIGAPLKASLLSILNLLMDKFQLTGRNLG